MRSTNPIAFTLTLLCLGLLGVIYLWTHRFPDSLRLWATLGGLIGCCLAGFYLWSHGVAVRFMLADIPTSRIASAPQGYVELVGTACAADERAERSPLDHLWKRTEFAQRASLADFRAFPFNLFYMPVETQVTEEPLGIRDETGSAVILPLGAEVICADRQVSYLEDRRRTDEYIRAGETLYVLGLFMTHQNVQDIDDQIERMLGDWKLNAAMRTRFDVNRDGYLSGSELLQMHRAARAQVMAAAGTEASSAHLHTVLRPAAGQRFVISTLSPEQLAGHYQWHLGGGLVLFFAGLAGAVMLYLRGML